MDEEEYQLDAKRAIEAVALERQLHPEETDEQLSQRLLREALPDAVRSMAYLSHFAEDPIVRAEARHYMRKNGRSWSAWFLGYEWHRQQANIRDGYPTCGCGCESERHEE